MYVTTNNTSYIPRTAQYNDNIYNLFHKSANYVLIFFSDTTKRYDNKSNMSKYSLKRRIVEFLTAAGNVKNLQNQW